ncbi:tyrosine-type recombinase/integrase [uncultured Nocardioides sp.]|uniref:tyrosine-type recombinase/integrase n=1 Tax=uncultured Nocardioides sp. TaxID=198441 RepID=UPI0026079276|nr:tyrosine-type recombinase/integrase [uncultured Nocardioides sp.]
MDTTTLPALLNVDDPMLRLAVAAHLARYKGQSRAHTASDLNAYLRWCLERDVMPLQAQRAHVELYLRWLQEIRHLRPSTVSRRLSVLATFYRTCVIDQILDHSPAEFVRRPHVPLESPTLGLSHLQFEAILTAGRDSANLNDFALVAMLGLLGLRIFEATGTDVQALGEARGHRVLSVHGKGDKTAVVPLPPAVGRAIDRAVEDRVDGPILLNRRGRRMDRHAATRRLRALARSANVTTARMHPHMLRHTFVTTMLDAGVDLRDVQVAARHADPARPCATTELATTSIATRTTSWLRSWPQPRDNRTCRIPDDPLWWWSYSPKRAPPNSRSALSGIDRATPQGPTGPRSPRRRIPVGYACAGSRVAFS